MRKIILFLALALGVKVNAQIVGGFLPINSSKSFTAGNSTFSNVIARGTLSVGSTATVTGALKASSTMSLGSANLTGGNTGTVAVLSDALFTTTHFHSNANTVDNVTFFFDKSLAGVSITSGVVGRTYLPYNCTLVGYSFESYISGTLGSAGNATVYARIDNTTDVTLTSTHNYTALTNYNNASNLNTNINAGSYIEIKIIVPDIVTAATNVSEYVTLYYVRRS